MGENKGVGDGDKMIATINKLLDCIDEIALLLNSLNRALAKEEWAVAYSVARKITDNAVKVQAELYFLIENLKEVRME